MDLWLLEVFFVAAAISPPSLIPAFWLSPPSLIPAFWLSPFGLLAITSIHGVLEHGVPYIGLLAFFGCSSFITSTGTWGALCYVDGYWVVCWTYDFLISWRPEKFNAFSIFIVAEHTAHALGVFLKIVRANW